MDRKIQKRSNWYPDNHETLRLFIERATMSHNDITSRYHEYKKILRNRVPWDSVSNSLKEFCKNFRYYVASKKPYVIHDNRIMFTAYIPGSFYPEKYYVVKKTLTDDNKEV